MDWHILTPGNPLDPRYSKAEDFFKYMAKRNANKQNVLYEICNEPNGSSVTWDTIAVYANKIIPVIHAAYDSVGAPHPIIVVGTPQWCQLVDAPIKEGRYQGNGKDLDAYLPDRDARLKYDNIMYAFHFYAASHNEGFEKDGKPHYYDMYSYLYDVLGRLPVFCTEFGCVEAWGGGDEDFDRTDKWLHMLSGNNAGKQTVSFCNWSFCDKEETASILQPGSCKANEWDRRTPSGEYLKRVLSVINWGAQDTTVLKRTNIYIKK
jgi:endoglucanase